VPGKTTVKVLKNGQADIAVFVEVVADGQSRDASLKGAHTSHNLSGVEWKTPGFEFQERGGGKKVVTKVTAPLQIKGTIVIQTVYGPGASPTDPSAYGRGTTPEDEEAGHVSLGFHESCHRADYLRFLRTQPLPAFRGKVGMSRADYEEAAAEFDRKMKEFFKRLERDSFNRTDEVGYKKSAFDRNGPRP
jgi:hypothetical protein